MTFCYIWLYINIIPDVSNNVQTQRNPQVYSGKQKVSFSFRRYFLDGEDDSLD